MLAFTFRRTHRQKRRHQQAASSPFSPELVYCSQVRHGFFRVARRGRDRRRKEHRRSLSVSRTKFGRGVESRRPTRMHDNQDDYLARRPAIASRGVMLACGTLFPPCDGGKLFLLIRGYPNPRNRTTLPTGLAAAGSMVWRECSCHSARLRSWCLRRARRTAAGGSCGFGIWHLRTTVRRNM